MLAILDKPYISSFIVATLANLKSDVLENPVSASLSGYHNLNLVNSQRAAENQRNNTYPHIYCNSENSLNWISQNLASCDLPKKIELFKDKVKFRELLSSMYPGFSFRAVNADQLSSLDPDTLPKPFIIKPAVGFFSMGVYRVDTNEEWATTLNAIQDEMKRIAGLYPTEVMDSSTFIIEEVIEGREFAVDAYYNSEGQVVILDILDHVFSSSHDVSDRLYLTSAAIMKEHRQRFTDLLQQIGDLASLHDFPVHVEFRLTSDDQCIPIEVNPMRFAGWCTTDIAQHAYGINVYEHYSHQIIPDWNKILSDDNQNVYALVVATLPPDVDHHDIESVDYDSYRAQFEHVLELRPINYHEYPVFAFLFAKFDQQNADNEIEKIMQLNFGDFLKLKKTN